MGKKARKTRWRTLTIADDDYSDSEESSTTTAHLRNEYQPKSYYNRFSYSSQSTPRRRYQHDSSTKSTRSSSTTSENKITFNEDEYTKITTPRQDVLFKKGYLNKPKNYQTQTSTGTSITSTGNSTGNGTPDHQSTDLEYESQFVFPNGFVDQNGIYYINSYETYPLMLYNPPTYYQESSNFKSKRYSTGSLTESMSPNNEEATSQDLSGGEASNTVSDYSGHHQVYNMVFPGYYVNGVCPTQDTMNGESQTDQTRRIKKRRRRKTSKSQNAQDSSEYTEDENDSSDENSGNRENVSSDMPQGGKVDEKPKENEEGSLENTETPEESKKEEVNGITQVEEETGENVGIDDASKPKTEPTQLEVKREEAIEDKSKEEIEIPIVEDPKQSDYTQTPTEPIKDVPKEAEEEVNTLEPPENTNEEETPQGEEPTTTQKSELKPDAEEFIPRAYRTPEIPINPNMQFIKVPPNFIPIPIMPLGDFNGQNYNPAFIPPGIPINFLPPDAKMYPNFVSFVPNTQFVQRSDFGNEESKQEGEDAIGNYKEEVEKCDKSNTAKDDKDKEHLTEKNAGRALVQNVNNKTIDIATIVSKLEEAAKEQDGEHQERNRDGVEIHSSPRRRFADNKNNRMNHRYKNIPNYKRNHYGSTQNSPQRNVQPYKNKTPNHYYEQKAIENGTSELENCPRLEMTNCVSTTESKFTAEDQSYFRRSAENRKSWKHSNSPHNGSPKWQPSSPARGFKTMQNGKSSTENYVRDYKSNKNYSNILKDKPAINNEQKPERYIKDKMKQEKRNIKTEDPKPSTLQNKSNNQWISVSSRKKRKNKTTDEVEVSFEDRSEHSDNDQFEKYDVEQLVDVVPALQEENIKVECGEEIEIKDIIENITQNETSLISNIENMSLNLDIRSVDDIERELIVKDPVETEIREQEVVLEITEISTTQKYDSYKSPENSGTNTESEQIIKLKTNKKSKKGSSQKQTTKRVIITDIDLSMSCEEVKVLPVKKIVTKLNEKPTQSNESQKEITTNKLEGKDTTNVEEEPPQKEDEEEKKKNKKKKKKPSKSLLTPNSLSSSNTTISTMDDSYDFLLDSALSPESVERTNVEISQELDKIIQKGMYSSLEGKIKSLNLDDSDGFFKSVFTNISSNNNMEKNGLSKTSDINKFLQDSRSLFRPNTSVSQENHSSHNTQGINTMLPDLDSSVEDGFFLKDPDVTDTAQGLITTTADKETKDKLNEDTNKLTEDLTGQKTLYPITEAVKEWMCRTRETTPDVELLKSPCDIYKEFCDSDSETDTIVSELISGDEEVTIFSTKNVLDANEMSDPTDDLLEFWENDVRVDGMDTKLFSNTDESNSIETNDSSKNIEQGEDVMEVYDSKYGKNEDYLKLQREIKQKMNSNNAKHGNLPYRAICCNIM